jgi:thioredoxin reductase
MSDAQMWDVIVIGGGAAGLSGALMLGRARRRVLVLDTGRPRNRFTAHMHGVLGRDGTSPADLLADGRAEIARYGGVIRAGKVLDVVPTSGGFEVVTDNARERARRVLLATGARDVLPDLDGLSELWGRGVAVCPYCDGYEVRDRPIGILATGPGSVFQAQLLRQWSDTVVYLADAVGAPEGANRESFDARGIRIVEGPVERVLAGNGRLHGVRMTDGREIALAAIFTLPRLVPRDALLDALEPAKTSTPMGEFLEVDPAGRTSIPGIWAAGNVANPAANVPVSIGAAASAAGAINHDLILEDIDYARSARSGQA